MKFTITFISTVVASLLLVGCGNKQPVESQKSKVKTEAKQESIKFLLVADGYRYESDVCHRVGESELTSKYLDDNTDLVACPEDITLVGNMDGAKEVLQIDGYRLFTVPTLASEME